MVEFISYDGSYPNLCAGELVLCIDGKDVNFGWCLCSGGRVWIDNELIDHVESGPWSVNAPAEYAAYTDEIVEVVNANVRWGCCGGCL